MRTRTLAAAVAVLTLAGCGTAAQATTQAPRAPQTQAEWTAYSKAVWHVSRRAYPETNAALAARVRDHVITACRTADLYRIVRAARYADPHNMTGVAVLEVDFATVCAYRLPDLRAEEQRQDV